MDPPAPSIAQRASAIKKAMEEVQQIRSKRQVADALNQRNGPSIGPIHALSCGSKVLVWRKGQANRSGKWTRPFELINIEDETCNVKLPSRPTSFRSTVVKPFHYEDTSNSTNQQISEDQTNLPQVHQEISGNQTNQNHNINHRSRSPHNLLTISAVLNPPSHTN